MCAAADEQFVVEIVAVDSLAFFGNEFNAYRVRPGAEGGEHEDHERCGRRGEKAQMCNRIHLQHNTASHDGLTASQVVFERHHLEVAVR